MTDAGQFNDGQAYERLMGRWSRAVGAIFLDWIAPPARLRWLDVGCGNGAFTELLFERCEPAAVVGVDPSEGQLAYARTRPGAGSAEFRQADAQSLPFPDAGFDVAVMALVIAFVPDPAKGVAEMARVVRPGGRVAAYMWDLRGGGVPLEPVYAALRTQGMDRPAPPAAAASGREAMEDLWRQAGLEAVESRVIRIPVSYADFDDFWASNSVPVGPLGAALQKLSSGQRDQLRDRLRERLPAGPDGRISYEAFANAVKGRVPGPGA